MTLSLAFALVSKEAQEIINLSSELLYQQQRERESFKSWIIREYSNSNLWYHPFWELSLEIQARWPNFPETGTYLDLALFLANNGACTKCKKAFRDAWENYINDA
jgi:hypothetical protein